MTSRHIRTIAFLPLAAAMLFSLSGCPWSPKTTVKPPDRIDSEYLDQSSAANVLANLKTAYENKNFQEYDKLFSTDYIFVFNPQDVVDPDNPTPQQWSRADEMDSARNLFSLDTVEGIVLNWATGDLEADDTRGWKVRVDNTRLSVTTRDENNVIWIYQVSGSTQIYFFREETARTPTGKNKWTCTRWEDSPIGLLKAQFASK